MYLHRSAELLDDFAPHLSGFERAGLDESPATILGVRPDFTIGYVNAAWWRFAAENGGGHAFAWGPGSELLSVIPHRLRRFYRSHLGRVFDGAERWEHDYLCSSPTEERMYRLRAVPLPGRAVLISHVLSIVMYRDDGQPFDASRFVASTGILTMCCHCRCTKDPHDDHWYWVPSLVERPRSRTSHALCATCSTYYYPP